MSLRHDPTPYYLELVCSTHSYILQDRQNISVSKDTSREDEMKNLVQAWEADQPGRSERVS